MIPRILIIDDLFGRDVVAGRNAARDKLCAHLQLRDVTGDRSTETAEQKVLRPLAEAIFHRGQRPIAAKIGDTVENDIGGAISCVRRGPAQSIRHDSHQEEFPGWSLVLVDLCFYTGLVTEASSRRDLGMPEGRPADDVPSTYFGLQVIESIHRLFPELPILVLSSKPREEVSFEFARRGALGFISRNDVRGAEAVQDALWIHGLVDDQFGDIVGSSLQLRLALRDCRRASASTDHVLIRGERGTGKELLASYLNRVTALALKQSSRPFVPVNAAAIAGTLFQSELFGIRPKTASGVDGKIGLMEKAKDGDLFLDEIADVPAEGQGALLRALQERQILPVGAREPISITTRVISATNVEIEAGGTRFRADLLDRLQLGGALTLPALRLRRSDIPELAIRFVREAERRTPNSIERSITPDTLALLWRYDWPGNIRELRSVLSSAVSRFPGVEYLMPAHLSLPPSTSTPPPLSSGHTNTLGDGSIDDLLTTIEGFEFDPSRADLWSGRFGSLSSAAQRLLARYLAAAIRATKRKTTAKPSGEILIHPATKLLTGNSDLTASKAADLVKRILKPLAPELDSELSEALQTAERLRPVTTKPDKRTRGKAK